MRVRLGFFIALGLAGLLGAAEAQELGQPRDAAAWVQLGLRYSQAGDPEEALIAFSKALEQDETLVEAWSQRAQCFEDEGDFARAVADLTQAHTLKPEDTEILFRRGALRQRKLDEHKGAIADFDAVLAEVPDHVNALHYRGDAKTALGRYREAIDDFDSSIEVEPTFSGVWYCRGCAYSRLSKPRRAIQDFDQAIALRIDWPAYFTERGAARFSLEQYADALEDFEAARKLDPTDTDTLFSLASSKRKLGDLEGALLELEGLRKLDPFYPKLDSLRLQILLQHWGPRIGALVVLIATIGMVVLFVALRLWRREHRAGEPEASSPQSPASGLD